MAMYLHPEKKVVNRNIGEPLFFRTDPFLTPLKGLIRTTRIMAVLSVCLFGLILAEAYGFQTDTMGIIQTKNLHFRSKPGQDSRSLMVLQRGTKVKVVEYSKGWAKIIHKGKSGYVRNREKYIRIQKSSGNEPVQLNDAGSTIQKYKEKAESIYQEIKKSNAKVLLITKKERETIQSLNTIERALNKAVKNSAVIKSEIEALVNKTAETRKEVGLLLKEIAINETYASRRLVALYKLNWLGKLHIIASAESFYELSQRKTALERILANDENILKRLSDNRARLNQLLKRQDAQRLEKLSLESEYKNQVQIRKKEKSKRAKLLSEIRNHKLLELAYMESLKEDARALDQKIKALSQVQPLPAIEKRSVEKAFAEYKGLLNMPVKGKVVSCFGSYRNAKFNVVNFRSGIDIKTERGEPIKAVSAGRVVFSSWFKGYGNMIIIDHGRNYYTVYANIEETFKKKGSEVETGEVIATVGDTGSGVGSKLYFEVRHHGKPVNPLDWIKKS